MAGLVSFSEGVVAGYALLLVGEGGWEAEDAAFGPDGYYRAVRVSAEGTPHLIPLKRIEYGEVQRDAIAPIVNRQFLTAERWKQLIYVDERLVIGVEIDGFHRAYPFQVMIRHEAVC